MKIVLLDVDDTLYRKGTGPFPYVNEQIDFYVMSWCHLGPDEARELRKEYIKAYGSTLGGLMRHHGVDPDDYLRKVHDVPVEDLLSTDVRLRDTLEQIPYELVVFSNGSVEYVNRVLASLGVADLFSDLFTIEFMDFIPKPIQYPYQKIMELYGKTPEECVLVDDRPPNVYTAIDMGMEAVLVGEEVSTDRVSGIRDIYEIASVLNVDSL
ncbi:MAG TPA: pyrimidine 5'-nucleotidase [Deltaproteobacteria bacterium]|nr:pyrimidine 5'-nucleotidase [Deltaproteobacteria bacterium]HPJ94532.1 pyrimidine 5'-nucleotidase [Deltaproteobacteria bacterium]